MNMLRASPRLWAWLLAGYAYLVTVAGATAVLWRGRVAEGLAPEVGRLLLWQALRWALWIPIGWALWRMFRKRGLSPDSLAAFLLAGLVAIPAQVLVAGLLATIFSPHVGKVSVPATAEIDLPVALLTYTALAALGWAAAAQARADRAAQLASDLAAALTQARDSAAIPQPQRLMVSAGPRRVLVDAADVEWFGSAGNYVVVNWSGREGLVRETLQALEQRLDPAVFARSHRSTIVNLARVQQTSSLSDGSWRLVMESGAELVVSRTYRDAVLRRLGRR